VKLASTPYEEGAMPFALAFSSSERHMFVFSPVENELAVFVQQAANAPARLTSVRRIAAVPRLSPPSRWVRLLRHGKSLSMFDGQNVVGWAPPNARVAGVGDRGLFLSVLLYVQGEGLVLWHTVATQSLF
jgi:hypothetical protein